MGRRFGRGHAAGLLAALLPNSIGLSGLLLTDAIFGHLMLMWLWCTWTLYRTGARAALGGAAVSLAAMQLLKPSMNMGGLLVICSALLLARRADAWRLTALLVLFTLPLPLFFAVRNLRDHGVFSPSLLGVATIREDLMARWEASSAAWMEWSRSRCCGPRIARSRPLFRTGRAATRKLYRVQHPKAREFFVTHPATALRLMLTEMGRQLVAPQEFPFSDAQRRASMGAPSRDPSRRCCSGLLLQPALGRWGDRAQAARRRSSASSCCSSPATASVSSWQVAAAAFPRGHGVGADRRRGRREAPHESPGTARMMRAIRAANGPVKIAFVIGQLGVGGGERQLYLLLKHLDRSRFDPLVITFNPDQHDYFEDKLAGLGVRVRGVARTWNKASRMMALSRLLRAEGADIVHAWICTSRRWRCWLGRSPGASAPRVRPLH
jgi:hypothetical protein